MNVNVRNTIRLATVATTVALGSAGFAGVAQAQASPVQFSPTFTVVPGGLCGAIVDATAVPLPQSGQIGIRASVTRFGVGCGAFVVDTQWKNLDTGATGGQYTNVRADGTVDAPPDGLIVGIGLAPGAGRVEATITTKRDPVYPDPVDLPNIPGHASFTLT